jgi:hypothetical protein
MSSESADAKPVSDPITKMRRKLREIINKAPAETVCKMVEYVKQLQS